MTSCTQFESELGILYAKRLFHEISQILRVIVPIILDDLNAQMLDLTMFFIIETC